jgi:hypothetical protein
MTPVEEMADVLVDAFARRATRVVYPRFSWLLYALCALLPTRPLTVTTRKVAPEIRRAYARQIQQDTNPLARLYHNVKANPNIEINVGPRRFAVTPRTVTPADSGHRPHTTTP